MHQAIRGLVALLFLGFFFALWWDAHTAALYALAHDGHFPPAMFTAPMSNFFSITSGLVSSVIVLELGMTKPWRPPGGTFFSKKVLQEVTFWSRATFWGYFAVWAGTGVWSLWHSLHYPDTLPVLSHWGMTWFGLVFASCYSYFGIKPPDSGAPQNPIAGQS